MSIKHDHQSAAADSSENVIQPSHWNAEHILTGMLAVLDVAAPTPNVVFTLNGSAQLQLLPYSSFAPSFSPAFTGVPTAPTPAPGVNSTQIATMEAVQTAITNLIGGAPGALDTLNELATAINDDASFSATVTAALGVRLRVDAAQGLTSGQMAQGRSNLGLGTVVTLNVGTAAGNVVQLDGSAKLPAVDGSQLTGINFTGALRYDTAQGLTAPQQSQARQNAGMTDGQLPATATNDSAAAGKIGEHISASQSANVALTSGTAANVTSITLTAGDWDVSGLVNFSGSAPPVNMQELDASLSTTSATLNSTVGFQASITFGAPTSMYNVTLAVPPVRFSLNATTTIYLVAKVNSASQVATGYLRARRER